MTDESLGAKVIAVSRLPRSEQNSVTDPVLDTDKLRRDKPGGCVILV